MQVQVWTQTPGGWRWPGLLWAAVGPCRLPERTETGVTRRRDAQDRRAHRADSADSADTGNSGDSKSAVAGSSKR